MSKYFSTLEGARFEGLQNKNPQHYRYYDRKRVVFGKTMEEWLRPAVCYWHSFAWGGADVFGNSTFNRPWHREGDALELAIEKADEAFAFMEKLGVSHFTFHDRDVAPEGKTLAESHRIFDKMSDVLANKMSQTGMRLLWGTANLFSHPRYMAGAATNPDPEVFAYAAAQVKKAMDVTARLGGDNYVLWGGREGYETLLNTDMKRELDQLARFLALVVEYKHKIGFQGDLLIEPKPKEPTKHQYDFDCATVYAFLQHHGLEKEFKVNIEANHAILSGHTFQHEVRYALDHGIFGSLDINRGDSLLGWDTDQFPQDVAELTLVLYDLARAGGFTRGGMNFDAKLRRQSADPLDLLHAHVGGLDVLARALANAERLALDNALSAAVESRYSDWDGPWGKLIYGPLSLDQLAARVLEEQLDPKPRSGRQEALENLVGFYT